MLVAQNDWVPPEQRYEASGQRPPRTIMKWLPVAIIVFAVVMLFIGVFFVLPGNSTTGDARFVSVTYDPLDPMPGETITLTIVVENCILSDITIKPYFEAMYTTDPGHFWEVSDGVYESTIGPYNDGSEIWYIIEARSRNGSYIYSYDNTIQVGDVERSSISTLSISDVQYIEMSSVIAVQANITSNATIIHTYMEYWGLEHYDGGGLAGTGGGDQMTASGNIFSGMIPSSVSTSHSGGEITETHTFFRIIVEDDSGNTAVSSPVHISGP